MKQITVAAVHVALFAAVWLWGVLVYAFAFARPQPVWVAIDVTAIGSCVAVIARRPDALGFASLGERRIAKLCAIVAFATLCVLVEQLVVPGTKRIGTDESNYLLTMHEQAIVVDGVAPFNMRWLVPLLAARWNVFPVDGLAALAALDFGALVVAAVALVLLLVRLRVPFRVAAAAPIFFVCSYLGVYAGFNRMALDPFNYAAFVVLFHTLLRREHAAYFAVALACAACNSEKVVYWIPVFAAVELARRGGFGVRGLAATLGRTAVYAAPVVVYFAVLAASLSSSGLETNLCFENLQVMSYSSLAGRLPETVHHNGFQILWFPFGAFTVYTLLGFARSPRAVKPVALLLLPIYAQALVACDTRRMVAYAFIVYLPFGFLYLARALAEMPRAFARIAFALSIALAVVTTALTAPGTPEDARMVAAAIELVLVGAIVFVHGMGDSTSGSVERGRAGFARTDLEGRS